MPDQSQWDVPAIAIANSRARYYANLDSRGNIGGELYTRIFNEEFAYTMDSDDELIDWASNNMNWSDVCINAQRVITIPPKQPDYQDGWVNGDKEIVSK